MGKSLGTADLGNNVKRKILLLNGVKNRLVNLLEWRIYLGSMRDPIQKNPLFFFENYLVAEIYMNRGYKSSDTYYYTFYYWYNC